MSIFQKEEWEPYLGPQGGEGWRNPDTDEVVYDDKPPGESEFELVDDDLSVDDLESGDEYVLAYGSKAHSFEVLDVLGDQVKYNLDGDGPNREIFQRLKDNLAFERVGDDDDSEETDSESEDSSQQQSVNLSNEKKEEIAGMVDEARRGGGNDEFNKELFQEIRSYSAAELDEAREETMDVKQPLTVLEEIQEKEGQDAITEIFNEVVGEEREEPNPSVSDISRYLTYEVDDSDEIIERLGEEYDVDYTEESFSTRLLDYIQYQKGDKEISDVVDVDTGVESVADGAFDKIGDVVDEDVEAYAMANLKNVNYDNLDGKSGEHRLATVTIDPTAIGKENVMIHELGHHFHNAIGLSNTAIDRENYGDEEFPDEPQWNYDSSEADDPLGIDMIDNFREAWEEYDSGNSQQLRKYQNRSAVEYAAISFRYAVNNPRKLERRDPEVKDFWDTVFSGGQE